MIKKLISGYYSRMLLICIVTVVTVTLTLFVLGSSLIDEQEKNEYLKNYDIELNNLSSILSAKQNTTANTLAPVFSSVARYQDLCDVYRDDAALTSTVNYSIVQMLAEICRYDTNCGGILLRTGNGRLYQYNTSYDTLEQIPVKNADIRFTPYQLQILSDAQLESLSAGYEKPSDHVFGLSTTVFDYLGGNMLPIGQLIILYSTSEFTNSITNAQLEESAQFTITDRARNIIYASDGNYESSHHLIFPEDTEEEDGKTARMTSGSAFLNGSKYYHGEIYNDLYEYYVNYQLPASLVNTGSVQMILGILALLICGSAIFLYVFTLRKSDRKIKTIQSGMSLVGQNNLDYRLPVPKSSDEFTVIINSFNGMCEELKENVEKAYLYEISQKKAELYAMQTSINPHFLYNTLEQIRVRMMQGGHQDASQMLLLLSKLYRNQTRRNLYVSIGEELDLCENLINLYMYRYGNFEYEFIVDNALKKYGIPKNTLQPLVENYFVHGLIGDREDNLLTISVQQEESKDDTCLVISVENNGAPITEEELASLEEKLSQPVLNREEDNGFALSNVNTRLKLVFGDLSRLCPGPGADGCGFRITFRIPSILPQDLK